MFYRILVAVNNSPISEKVFEDALLLAKSTGAHLMLLNVISPFDASYLSSTKNFPHYLYQLCQKTIELGVSVEIAQNLGDPGKIICEIASSWDADLIIIGRNDFCKLNLGTNSSYVLCNTSCSVLIVQEETACWAPSFKKMQKPVYTSL